MKREDFFLVGEEAAPQPILYRASGLEGIYLLNGYEVQEHDGEKHMSVKDVDGLHRAIGRHLVLHRKALLPKEVRFLRNTLDLTQAEFAQRLSNTSQSVARWEKGECEIPGSAEKLLRAVFLASLINEEELVALRDLLMNKLAELDCLDETSQPPAQFHLHDFWSERELANVA